MSNSYYRKNNPNKFKAFIGYILAGILIVLMLAGMLRNFFISDIAYNELLITSCVFDALLLLIILWFLYGLL